MYEAPAEPPLKGGRDLLSPGARLPSSRTPVEL
jgi:hypothetical protein